MSRSKKVLINSLFGMAGYALLMLSNFITRAVFVDQLGLSMAGVDTTFKNFLQVLSLAELGLSTGLLYKLYKPIEEKNNREIKKILNFYKYAYKLIAMVFMAGAFLLCLLVNFVVSDTGKAPWYISLLFLLYAADTVASYLFANRKALIVADQNNYIVNRNDAFISLITLISQVSLLYVTGSFVVYAVVKVVCRLIGASLIGRKFKKMYPAIASDRSRETLVGEERRSLIKNMSAMLCHRVGGVSVTATGSAIVAKFLTTTMAGIYGNYTIITTALSQLAAQVFNGITASFGNILTAESRETAYKRFNLLYFFNYLLFCFMTVSIGVIVQPFMKLWIGADSLLPQPTVLLLLCYFYVFGIRRVVLMAKDSAGIYREDQWFAIAEAVVNIVLSVILVNYMEISGIVLANLLSMLLIPLWTQPYLVYSRVLGKSVLGYYLRYILYLVMTAGLYFLTAFTAKWIVGLLGITNLFLELLVRGSVCVIVPNVINLAVFWRTAEMRDMLAMFRGVLKRKK